MTGSLVMLKYTYTVTVESRYAPISSIIFELSLSVSLNIFFGKCFFFVVKVFTLSESNFDFYELIFEINFEGNAGETFLFYLGDEFI